MRSFEFKLWQWFLSRDARPVGWCMLLMRDLEGWRRNRRLDGAEVIFICSALGLRSVVGFVHPKFQVYLGT